MKKILLLGFILLFTIAVQGQEKCAFYQDKTWGDVLLYNKDRGKGGRILVPGMGNIVTLNFANDFAGGLLIGGWGSVSDALAYFNINGTIPIVFNKKIKSSSIYSTGKIGIGVEDPKERLEVNGTIRAKEVKIEVTGWADFVFQPGYQLKPLSEVENHIKEHKHLPDIPSEAEVKENGISIGEIQTKLLQKVEELTLYVIELKKENEEQNSKMEKQNSKIEELENENEKIKKENKEIKEELTNLKEK